MRLERKEFEEMLKTCSRAGVSEVTFLKRTREAEGTGAKKGVQVRWERKGNASPGEGHSQDMEVPVRALSCRVASAVVPRLPTLLGTFLALRLFAEGMDMRSVPVVI